MGRRIKLPKPLEELKERFLETEELRLIDGSLITPEEMWEYACLPFTGKYRHAIDFRFDLGLLSFFRHRYLYMSALDRIKRMHEKGTSVIFTFGGGLGFPGGELVYGCHAITYGLTQFFNEVWWDEKWEIHEEAHRWTSFESCPGEPPVALMARDGLVPTDMIISGTGVFGDLPCANHLIRRWNIPLHFVDIPFNGKGKEWALEYLAEQFSETVDKISKVTGKRVSTEDLNKGIRMINELYETYREYVDIITCAEVPPIASLENVWVTGCVFDYISDPVALAQANRALNSELRERVKKGANAPGVVENPIRIYMCEKMPSPPGLNLVDDLGGILLGPEVCDSYYLVEPIPADTDDPCRAMAEWCLQNSPWSHTQPLEDRTDWVLQTIRKYRPEGIIFSPVWGCQLDPQYHRYIADAIEREFGIPWTVIIQEDVPVEIGSDGKYHLKGNTRTRIEGFMEMLKARRRCRN